MFLHAQQLVLPDAIIEAPCSFADELEELLRGS